MLTRPRAPGWSEADLGAPCQGKGWCEQGQGPARSSQSLRLPARCWPRSFLWQCLTQAIFMLCEKSVSFCKRRKGGVERESELVKVTGVMSLCALLGQSVKS